MLQRPSHRELDRKLKDAKNAINEKRAYFAHPEKVIGELMELKVGDNVWNLIGELLEEIKPSDYRGVRPPMKSYEQQIRGCELFAFSWHSKRLANEMYIKFVVKDGVFYYVSLHKNRPPTVQK